MVTDSRPDQMLGCRQNERQARNIRRNSLFDQRHHVAQYRLGELWCPLAQLFVCSSNYYSLFRSPPPNLKAISILDTSAHFWLRHWKLINSHIIPRQRNLRFQPTRVVYCCSGRWVQNSGFRIPVANGLESLKKHYLCLEVYIDGRLFGHQGY